MHRVFLSSTAHNLTAYRDAVTDAINRLDSFHCVRMEDFGARDSQADEFCQAKIVECEVAVFIIGLCYGSSPKGSKESYTHREYLAAKKAGKPILVFLSAEGEFYKGYDREPDRLWRKQQAFRKLLNEEHMLAPWLQAALDQASQAHFGQPAMLMGEGGTIPFPALLGQPFPQAQYLITGVLGPHSNAHGPNEFLHLPYAKQVTCCLAQILAVQAQRALG